VTAIAAYGSVAKDEDREHSDLDLWVATSEPIEDVRFFVYRGLPVSVNWDTEEGRIRSAGRVTPSWPLDADELRSYVVLYERGDFLQRLRDAASNLRDDDFQASMRVLMARAAETVGKLRNAYEARNHYRLLVVGRTLVFETTMLLGLLNRTYYPGGRNLYRISAQMPRQPDDYPRLLDLAGGFSTVESEVVYGAALKLWANLCKLMRSEGVQWESNDLPF